MRRVREAGPGRIVVERMTEEGADVVESPLPAVLSVVKEINTPRLPSLKGKMRAKSFKPVVWDAAALGADEARLGFAGSPTKVVKVFHPEARRGGEMHRRRARRGRGEPGRAAARAGGLSMTTVRVKPDECTGCGECVPVCPVAAIEMRAGAAFVTDACTACGICVTTCPVEAIEMEHVAPPPGRPSRPAGSGSSPSCGTAGSPASRASWWPRAARSPTAQAPP